MLKHVNVKELETRFVKLQSELITLRSRFYSEATASLEEATHEFETWRAKDGGLTEQACWMLGLTKRLEDTLCNKGISEFMNTFEELDYDVWAQLGHEWWSLGLAIESVEAKIEETKKALISARLHCQMEKAFKDAGF